LHQRTYSIEIDGDTEGDTDGGLVYAGTTAGVVVWDFSDLRKVRRTAVSVLRDSVNHIANVPGTSLLVVSTGPSGVAVMDARDARDGKLALLSVHPQEPDVRKLCHAAWYFAPVGSTGGYLACGGSGVVQLDLSDRAKPVVSKHANVDGYVRGLAVLDAKRVLAAAGRRGLALIDFGGATPQVTQRIALDADVRGVTVRDGLAYVAAGEAGLVVVKVSGSSLEVVSRFMPKTTDMARSVGLSGSLALLCLGDSGLAILDVSDPQHPVEVSRFDPKGAVNRVTVSGSRLFMANDSDGIAVLDVSRPKEPKQVFPVLAQTGSQTGSESGSETSK